MRTGQISLRHAAFGLSSALDLVSRDLVRHHVQTTTVCSFLGLALGLSEEERGHLEVAAALHDIGAISMNREGELFSEDADHTHHAEVGWLLLRTFAPFRVAADIVRDHHTPWAGAKARPGEERQLFLSHILHLADRIAVRIKPGVFVLAQAAEIEREIVKRAGWEFGPEVVEAFLKEAKRDVFWLETAHASFPGLDGPLPPGPAARADDPALRQLSELFRMVIDFRSNHTATHSKAVAVVAERIAKLIGFSGRACAMMHVAGNLHDLGKLAVPASILDKPGKLTADELAIIRSHPYHTGRVLKRIAGFDEIAEWAALHHENLDGTGYPWKLGADQIPLGARIVAIADAFSALSEHRSYRPAMTREEILRVMRDMVKARKLDPFLVNVFEHYYDELEKCRAEAFAVGEREFNEVRAAAELIYLQPAARRREGTEPESAAG